MTRPHIRRNRQTVVTILTNITLILPYQVQLLNNKMKHSASTAKKLETFSIPRIPLALCIHWLQDVGQYCEKNPSQQPLCLCFRVESQNGPRLAPMVARINTIHLPSSHQTEVLPRSNLRNFARFLGKNLIPRRPTSRSQNWLGMYQIWPRQARKGASTSTRSGNYSNFPCSNYRSSESFSRP